MADVKKEHVECRICQSSSKANLIQCPCLCKGSLGHVHISCMEDWLSASCRDSCELCSHKFKLVRVRRYDKLESVFVWLSISANRNMVYKVIPMILATCVTFAALLFDFISLTLDLSEMEWEGKEAKERTKNGHEDEVNVALESSRPFWFDYLAFFLYLIVLAVGVKETHSLVKMLFLKWRRWWVKTCVVRIVLDSHCDKTIGKVEVDLDEGKDVILKISESSVDSFYQCEESNLQPEVYHKLHKTIINIETV